MATARIPICAESAAIFDQMVAKKMSGSDNYYAHRGGTIDAYAEYRDSIVIEHTMDDIRATFEKHNIIVHRPYKGQDILVVGCGHTPPYLYDKDICKNSEDDIENSKNAGYVGDYKSLVAAFHNHRNAYTVNIEPQYNPDCVGEFGIDTFTHIPSASFSTIYLEGCYYTQCTSAYWDEIYRILKDGGVVYAADTLAIHKSGKELLIVDEVIDTDRIIAHITALPKTHQRVRINKYTDSIRGSLPIMLDLENDKSNIDALRQELDAYGLPQIVLSCDRYNNVALHAYCPPTTCTIRTRDTDYLVNRPYDSHTNLYIHIGNFPQNDNELIVVPKNSYVIDPDVHIQPHITGFFTIDMCKNFPDGAFDRIVIGRNGIMHFGIDTDQHVRDCIEDSDDVIRRILKPGGIVVQMQYHTVLTGTDVVADADANANTDTDTDTDSDT